MPDAQGRFKYLDVDSEGNPVSHVTWIHSIEPAAPDAKGMLIGLVNKDTHYPVSVRTARFPQLLPAVFDTPMMAELYKQDMIREGMVSSDPSTWMPAGLSLFGFHKDGSKATMPVCKMRMLYDPCPFCGEPLVPWYNVAMTGEDKPMRAHVHDCPAKNGDPCLIVIDDPARS